MRPKFREVTCDLHRMGLLTRCQEGEVPAWPGCHHGPAMSAKMASLLLTGSSKSAPAASSVQLPTCLSWCVCLLSALRQATLTLRLWSAHDPTFASACELAEGAPVGSPDSSPLRTPVPSPEQGRLEGLGQGPRAPLRGMCEHVVLGFLPFPLILRKPQQVRAAVLTLLYLLSLALRIQI